MCLLWCAAVLLFSSCTADPCTLPDKMNMYNGRRNTEFMTDSESKCDYGTINDRKWYRFDHPTGSRLATECPGQRRCGTNIPVWMDGQHPTDDKEVSHSVYMHTSDGCKDNSLGNVSVARCTDGDDIYYVYRLPTIPYCDLVYCTEFTNPCPPHFSWNYSSDACQGNNPPALITTDHLWKAEHEVLVVFLEAEDADDHSVRFTTPDAIPGITLLLNGKLAADVTDNLTFTLELTDELSSTSRYNMTITVYPCPCKNLGQCVSDHFQKNNFTCECPDEFYGELCEKLRGNVPPNLVSPLSLWKADNENITRQLEASHPEGHDVMFGLGDNQATVHLNESGFLSVDVAVSTNLTFSLVVRDEYYLESWYNMTVFIYSCPCLNGGSCRTDALVDLSFICLCSGIFDGVLCEKIVGNQPPALVSPTRIWKDHREWISRQLRASDPEGHSVKFMLTDEDNVDTVAISLEPEGRLNVSRDLSTNTSLSVTLTDEYTASSIAIVDLNLYNCPCQHGGTCETTYDHILLFVCHCTEQYEGERCELTKGTWGTWSSWGVCSVPCDYGTRVRTRICVAGQCPGPNKDTQLCNTNQCSVDDPPARGVYFDMVLAEDSYDENHTMLQVATSRQIIVSAIHDQVNAICDEFTTLCCGSDDESVLRSAGWQFVPRGRLGIIKGYPQQNGVSLVRLKIDVSLGKDDLAVSCPSQDPKSWMLSLSILQSAVEKSSPTISEEALLDIVVIGTEQGQATSTTNNAWIVGGLIGGILLLVGVVTLACIISRRRQTKIQENASPQEMTANSSQSHARPGVNYDNDGYLSPGALMASDPCYASRVPGEAPPPYTPAAQAPDYDTVEDNVEDYTELNEGAMDEDYESLEQYQQPQAVYAGIHNYTTLPASKQPDALGDAFN